MVVASSINSGFGLHEDVLNASKMESLCCKGLDTYQRHGSRLPVYLHFEIPSIYLKTRLVII